MATTGRYPHQCLSVRNTSRSFRAGGFSTSTSRPRRGAGCAKRRDYCCVSLERCGDDDEGDAAKEEEEEKGGLFILREKTKDEREEAEYRAYLEREVGLLKKILDIGDEEKVVDEVGPQEEHVHLSPGEADSGKKEKKE